MTHQEYEKLCQEVWEHSRRYYVEARPTISDEAFDALLRKVEAAEKRIPNGSRRRRLPNVLTRH